MNSDDRLYRILDASANRAGEGMRTIEDFVRLGRDDADLANQTKSLRHELAQVLLAIDRDQRLDARDTDGDVGTTIHADNESVRRGMRDVVAAACERVAQALRGIEEYGKLIDANLATRIESIRYRFYDLSVVCERAAAASDRRARLADACLYGLIDGGRDESDFIDRVGTLCEARVDVLQLRDHRLDDRTLIERGRLGTNIAREHDAIFIMNDRADLAAAADCDGVHVGQEELPVEWARRIVGHDRIVGLSTHNVEQVHAAERSSVDYIGCGPIFEGKTKSFNQYVGPDFLAAIRSVATLPYFAIGGIDESNVDRIIRVGCSRIAVTAALREATDPVETATRLRARLRPEPSVG